MGTIYRTASYTTTGWTYAKVTITFRWAEIETEDSYTIEMVDITASNVSYTGGTQAQRQADYNSICSWLKNIKFEVYVFQSGGNEKYAGGILDSAFSPGTTRPVNIHRSAIVLKNKTGQSINVCGCSTGDQRTIRTTTSVTIPRITSYNITIHANGGGSDIIYTKWYNEPLILNPQDLSLQYYKLIGFSESLNQAHIGDIEYTANDTYVNNESIELYATWELEYSKPTINNVKINRCLSDGTLDDTGENISLHFTWSVFRSNLALYYGGDNFPYINNGSAILLEVGEFSKTLSLSSDVGIVDEILGNDSISENLEYICTITLSDTELIQTDNTIIYSDKISSAYFPIDFNAMGTAMGIFRPAPDNEEGVFLGKELNVKGSAVATGNLQGENVLLELDTTEPPDTTTTDGQIYQALKDLGWDSDVIV